MKKYMNVMMEISVMEECDIVRTSLVVTGDDVIGDAFKEVDNPSVFVD